MSVHTDLIILTFGRFGAGCPVPAVLAVAVRHRWASLGIAGHHATLKPSPSALPNWRSAWPAWPASAPWSPARRKVSPCLAELAELSATTHGRWRAWLGASRLDGTPHLPAVKRRGTLGGQRLTVPESKQDSRRGCGEACPRGAGASHGASPRPARAGPRARRVWPVFIGPLIREIIENDPLISQTVSPAIGQGGPELGRRSATRTGYAATRLRGYPHCGLSLLRFALY